VPAQRSVLLDCGHWILHYALLITITLLVSGCASDYPPDLVAPVPNESEDPDLYRPVLEARYTIAPGDQLLINSYYHSDLKQPVTVQPDGHVSLLLVGDVVAGGKTPQQLAEELSRAYGKFLEDADLTVTVSESVGLSVYVGGEVAKPAMLPIRGELTLLQSITQAGGFLATANREQVLVVRQTADGHYRTLQANVEQVLRNEGGEIYLRRHDVVYVPKTQIAKVNQFVEQYINEIIPHFVNTVFSYQLLSAGSGATVISPAATTAPR
jgi:protein involved in polysaccharide export with SLBB domain